MKYGSTFCLLPNAIMCVCALHKMADRFIWLNDAFSRCSISRPFWKSTRSSSSGNWKKTKNRVQIIRRKYKKASTIVHEVLIVSYFIYSVFFHVIRSHCVGFFLSINTPPHML